MGSRSMSLIIMQPTFLTLMATLMHGNAYKITFFLMFLQVDGLLVRAQNYSNNVSEPMGPSVLAIS